MLVKTERILLNPTDYENSKIYDVSNVDSCINAWNKYKSCYHERQLHYNSHYVDEEECPPPEEKLLLFILNLWETPSQIQQSISCNVLRLACHLYSKVLKYCLSQPKVIATFNASLQFKITRSNIMDEFLKIPWFIAIHVNSLRKYPN